MPFATNNLRVHLEAKDCHVPTDERERLQSLITPLAEAVSELPAPELSVEVIYHPRSQTYHAELRLEVPGKTLRVSAADPYLDSALERSIRDLHHKAADYAARPNEEAVGMARRREALHNGILAAEATDEGPLAHAVAEGDYAAFRMALARYEEWLRKRVGRLIQRRPDAQARLGKDLRIGDVVEEVYLRAFEMFTERSTNVALSQWLEELIDPSISEILRHPDQEREATSLARTLRETPL